MCPAVVSCATADEESGSSLKFGSCVGQHYGLFGTKRTCFEKSFLSNETLHKNLLSANKTLASSLIYPVHYIMFIPPSVGVVGLAEYVCTHPILNFYRGRPMLHSRRRRVGYRPAPSLACGLGSPAGDTAWRKTLMTPLFIINIVVWVWVVILVIVALLCSLPRRVVRWWTIWCNKCVISLLGLMFVSHLNLLLWGDASARHELKHNNNFCQI